MIEIHPQLPPVRYENIQPGQGDMVFYNRYTGVELHRVTLGTVEPGFLDPPSTHPIEYHI